ncbi:carboxymuconolactone decarboxylase family protein [Nocardia alni]|uniref:carboxymuconolactone decarboxylase family protein n=1 Tax=Nocardia alni TaxID=2815723 RepID=UPI0027E160AF|nr:carboxymuconolactone decarboxylase family protein [Nocardia alni]
MSTLARHPDLAEAYLALGVHLNFRSTSSHRAREFVVLRVAHRRRNSYIWSAHVRSAVAQGLSDLEIEAVRSGQLPDAWDQALIAAVDELDERSELTDRTWATLGEFLDERQRMDLIFTVGCFTMLSFAYNAFGVQLETGP